MDRTYAVMGAASGIGGATTAQLRACGARVIACDLRDTGARRGGLSPRDVSGASVISGSAA